MEITTIFTLCLFLLIYLFTCTKKQKKKNDISEEKRINMALEIQIFFDKTKCFTLGCWCCWSTKLLSCKLSSSLVHWMFSRLIYCCSSKLIFHWLCSVLLGDGVVVRWLFVCSLELLLLFGSAGKENLLEKMGTAAWMVVLAEIMVLWLLFLFIVQLLFIQC